MNSVFEVGGYGDKWGPVEMELLGWGSPLLTEMVPKPLLSLSPDGHSLFLC